MAANNSFEYQECAELHQARLSSRSSSPEQALRTFERAIKRHPRNLLVLQEACMAFTNRYELRKAHTCIERVLRFASQQQPQVYLLAGQMNMVAYRPKQALICFQRACQSGLVPLNARIESAGLLEKSGQDQAAAEQIESVLAEDPDNGLARYLNAHIRQKLGDLDAADEQFANLASDEQVDDAIRSQALNGWAHLFDRQGQYATAFDKLMESKSLLLSNKATSEINQRYDQEYSAIRRVMDRVNDLNLEGQNERVAHAPGYLLTGCPRSGTTLIEKVLDAHSEIVSADEYNVFTSFTLPNLLANRVDTHDELTIDEINQIPLSVKRSEAKRYRKANELAMGEKIGRRHFIDKNPGLTGHIPAFLAMSPTTQIIYALRDPRDTMLSSLFRWLPLNTASVSFLDPSTASSHIAQELGFWIKLRDVLPSEIWRETRYEKTVEDVKMEAASLLDWMELDWEDGISAYRDHLSERGVNSPTYGEVSQPVHNQSVGKWKHYQSQLEPHFEGLNSVLGSLGYSE